MERQRPFPVLVAVAVASLLLAACGRASEAASEGPGGGPWVAGVGGSMVLGISAGPTGCNPNTPNGATWANQLVLAPVLPSAFFIDPTSQAVYDQSVISSAELQNVQPQTIVYTIDPKATWSDGVPVTAEDFIYAWEEQRGSLDSGAAASTAGYRDIASITPANHGKTFTVVFKTPYADWQRLFANLLPAHIMGRVGWDPPCSTVDPAIDLSAGPFVIERASRTQITLARNPKWWGTPPDLNQLTIDVASSPAQLVTWLREGKVQAIQPLSFDRSFLNSVTSIPSAQSDSGISTTFLQLVFSTVAPATADARIRTAIAHALDRQQLVYNQVGWADSSIVPAASHFYSQVQTAYPTPKPQPPQIAAQPGNSPPPTSSTPTAAQPFPLAADPAAMARILSAAGYTVDPEGHWVTPTGQPMVLRLAVDSADGWADRTATAIAHQLSEVGIQVTVDPLPDLTSAGMALANQDADMAVLPYQASPYPTDALAWFTPLLGAPGDAGSQDWSNFADPGLNQLLTKASQQLNPVTAQPLYTQADALLWTQMVALPLFAEPTALAWSRYTTGVTLNPTTSALLWNPGSWALLVPPSSPDTASTSSTTQQ